MPRIRIFLSFFILLLIVTALGLPRHACAQDNPNLEIGLKAYGSFQAGGIDSVSMNNGNLFVRVPLWSLPQRGVALNLKFSLAYNNKGFSVAKVCNVQHVCYYEWAPAGLLGFQPVEDDQIVVGGGPVYTSNNSIAGYTATAYTADGGVHQMGQMASGTDWETLDGTGIRGVNFHQDSLYGWMFDSGINREGVRYAATHTSAPCREDTNGNEITGCTNSHAGLLEADIFTYTDTLGRVVNPGVYTTDFSNCSGSLPTSQAETLSYPSLGGTNVMFKLCYASISLQTHFGYSGIREYSGTRNMLQSIVLPNLTTWTFAYDNGGFGDLTQVTFPTGGTLSYVWGNLPLCYNYYLSNSQTPASRAVVSRTLNANDNGGNHTWIYSWGPEVDTSNSRTRVDTLTDAAGNDTDFTETGLGNSCSFYETQRQVYQGTGSNRALLQTTQTSYTWESNPWDTLTTPYPLLNTVLNVQPTTIKTIWANGQTTQVNQTRDSGFIWKNPGSTATYSGTYNDVISELVYDYGTNGPGPLLRRTSTTYLFQQNANYVSNNIIDNSYSMTIYDSTANQCNGVATYCYYEWHGYDESGLQSSDVAEQHDSQPPAGSYRGNQTSLHRWLNGSTVSQSPCNVSVSNGYLVSNNVYYDTGEVQQSTDPCMYPTTYQYSSTYYGAFPTTVTNALTQSTNYGYDFNTGVVTSIQDANLQPTTKTYDILARLTSVSYPDGGSTSYCYTDMGGATCTQSGPPYEVISTKAITSSPVLNETSTLVFDGLGRLSQTQLNSDTPSTTYTQTTYDALGRKSQAYNPTRCSPPTTNCGTEPTWGYTTTNYDALGRVTSVVEQDGSTVSTSYAAFPCTTATEEAGKARKLCVDGLGRMTGVWEDPTGLDYETDYQYDILGNLINVSQKGSNSASARTRTFTYDSLSRLLCAANPEIQVVSCPTSVTGPFPAGAITYAYDADGNVITKTSPLPNQTLSATVTATSTYDKLNRLTGKSYKDGTVTDPYTPSVLYGYDGIALSGCTKTAPVLTDTYPIGRRTSMCDGSGATSWDHDQLGRVKQDDRFIGSVTPGRFVNYGYNLDGSLAFVTTPPLKTVAYTYSGAGRPVQAVDNTDGISFATNATYAPPGELFNLLNGGTIHAVATYNSRLQPLQMFYGTNTPPALTGSTCPATVGNIMHRLYNFSLGSGDNGNALSIANCRDTTRSESFTYDALNRISSAQSSGSQWGETFTIDAWGNLINEAQITGKTNHEGLNTTAGTNNQLAGFGYDAAGNLISNTSIGATYTYDAENRLIWTSGYRYVYDGDGKRVEKCVAATSTTPCPTSGTNGALYWRGVSSETLDESDLSGNPQEEYVFFNGQRIARRDVTSTGATIAVHYYFSDHLGTHAVVTDATGTQIEQDADYYPYGGVQHDYATAPVAQHYKFTGKERDGESGLDYFVHRHYASTMGRFMQPDPDGISSSRRNPQTWNMYAYVLNNPLRFTDPDGMNYTVCDTNGKNCADLTDKQYDQWRKDNPNVQVSASGAISIVNDNGSTTKVGQESYYNEKDIQAAQQLVATQGLILNLGARMYIGGITGGAFGWAAGEFIGGLAEGLSAEGEVAATAESGANTIVGSRRSPISVAPGTNEGTTIGGRWYTGHALDQMQGRGLMPSVIEDTIKTGTASPGNTAGTTVYMTGQARVVVNSAGDVVTAMPK